MSKSGKNVFKDLDQILTTKVVVMRLDVVSVAITSHVIRVAVVILSLRLDRVAVVSRKMKFS